MGTRVAWSNKTRMLECYPKGGARSLQREGYGAKAGALSRLRAANSITAFICSRPRPSNHSMMSSRLAPASRFSKMADTGIRVPFKTHAPLTLPGTLSTAGHCDQSRFAMDRTPAQSIALYESKNQGPFEA